jgi:hypothetical protein
VTLFDRVVCHVVQLGARALAAGRVDMAFTGLEHIPTEGSVLVVARHYHYLFDGIVLLASIPRPLRFLVSLDWATNSCVRRLLTPATTLSTPRPRGFFRASHSGWRPGYLSGRLSQH